LYMQGKEYGLIVHAGYRISFNCTCWEKDMV